MKKIRDIIYGNAWFFWIVNYLLAIYRYDTLIGKIYTISICFIVVLLYVGTFYMVEFNKKQLRQRRKDVEYKNNFYIGRYRALINSNFTKDEFTAYLNVYDATQEFKLRNGVYD